MGAEFQIGKIKKKNPRDGWWRWLHNHVNVLSTTEPLKTVKMVNFMLFIPMLT